MKRGDTLKIEAKAGTGKTSTLVEIAKANPGKRFLYLAFNKAIAEEAGAKFPFNTITKTTHSWAYRKIIPLVEQLTGRKNFIKNKISPFAYKEFIRKNLGIFTPYLKYLEMHENRRESTSFGRTGFVSECFFYTLGKKYEEYLNSDLDEDDPRVPEAFRFISAAIRKFQLPYTHSFYLKEYQLRHNYPEINDKFDFVLLDEAQDTNPVTMSIISDVTCAKIFVGDSNQSMYGFRGAVNAMTTFNANATLYLSHCFRCGEDIIAKANYFLGKYDWKSEKIVQIVSRKPKGNTDTPCAAVLSRSNSGLIHEFCHVLDNEPEFLSQIKFVRPVPVLFAPALNVLKLIDHFNTGATESYDSEFRYFSKFNSRKNFEEYIDDTLDVELKLALAIVDKYGSQLNTVYEKALQTVENRNPRIYFSTAHTAKGLEFNEVALLGDYPGLKDTEKKAQEGRTKEEINRLKNSLYDELCIYYVGLTRAKDALFDLSENDAEYNDRENLPNEADDAEAGNTEKLSVFSLKNFFRH